MKHLSVGTLESSDCLITLKENNGLKITIDTPLEEAFLNAIHDVIETGLKHHNISNIHVILQDKGALDFTIKARLETAIKRWMNDE